MTLDSIRDSCDVLKYIISVWFCGVAIVIAKHPSSISVPGVKKRVLQIETCKKPLKKGAIFPSKPPPILINTGQCFGHRVDH